MRKTTNHRQIIWRDFRLHFKPLSIDLLVPCLKSSALNFGNLNFPNKCPLSMRPSGARIVADNGLRKTGICLTGFLVSNGAGFSFDDIVDIIVTLSG